MPSNLLSSLKWLAVVPLSFGLAGCGHAPLENTQPLADIKALSWSEKVAVPQKSNLQWRDIQDAVLAGLIKDALQHNLDMQSSAKNIALSRLQLKGRQKNKGINYGVTARTGLSDSRFSDLSTSFSLGATASYEIDLWGRVADGIALSELSLQAAQLSQETLRISLIAEISDSYYGLRVLDAQLQSRQKTLANTVKLLEFTRARKQAGLLSGVDVDQQVVNLESQKVSIEDLKANRKKQVLRLSRLTGKVPQALELPAMTSLALPSIRLKAGTPADVLRNRPDIQGQEIAMAQSYRQFEIARKSFFPALSLTAGSGVANSDLGQFLSGSLFSWNVGANIVTTLLDNGGRDRAVESARISAQRQMLTYRATILRALEEVDGALINQETAHRQLAQLDRQLKAQMRVMHEFEAKYKSGTVSAQNLIQQQNSLLSLESSILNTKLSALRSSITLMRMMGVRPL